MPCFSPAKEIIMLVPPELTEEQKGVLADWAYHGIPGHTRGISARHTYTHSHVTAVNCVLNGLPSSELYIVDGHKIGAGLTPGWLMANCPEVMNTRRVVWIETSETELPIDRLSQRDPRWKDVKMGTDPTTGQIKTIGNWGCLLVAYNSFARYWGLCQDTPDQFLTRMRGSGAMSGPFLLSGALSTTFPQDVKYLGVKSRGEALNTAIRASLDRLVPVPIRVDFIPATARWEQHWCLAIGYNSTDFVIFDPWHGDITLLSGRYGTLGPLDGLFYEKVAASPSGYAPLGLHARADSGDMSDVDINEFGSLHPDIIKVLSYHSPGSGVQNRRGISNLAQAHPGVPFIIRAFLSFGGRNISASQFVADTINDVVRSISAVGQGHEIWLEPHNEPNLHEEGLGSSWPDGASFGSWLSQVITLYRAALPATIRYLYPGLSPGGSIAGVRQDSGTFFQQSLAAALQCDGVGVHCYWSRSSSMQQAINHLVTVGNTVPAKALVVSEASINDRPAVLTPAQYASEYLLFARKLKAYPKVKGITFFVASASQPAFYPESWIVDGASKGIGALMGAR